MGMGNLYVLKVILPLLVMALCTVLPPTECVNFHVAGPPPFLSHGRRGSLRRTGESLVNHHELDLSSAEYETHYYTQILDHFTYRPEGYRTFPQRYLVYAKHWGGPQRHSPIFVYMGAESSIISGFNFCGFMFEKARHFQALLVYIEHRYYGLSMPFGSREESFRNASTLGYFTSTQAMADYATLILDLKKNLSAENSPVIVFGASYGGMLAAWFRLKYPHVTIGALAASAPILYFDDITPQDGYDRVVTQDFRNASESCYNTIKESWAEINKVASQPGGLESLKHTFNTCRAFDASSLMDWLTTVYDSSAQYGSPPVKEICKSIDGFPKGTDILTRISAGSAFYYNYDLEGTSSTTNNTCLDIQQYPNEGWSWQECTEMVMPFSSTPNTTMYPLDLFDFKSFAEDCKRKYGVVPRPHWITTEFGGHNIRRVLKRFASNIIFSNGLRDPYSSGGVTKSISESVIALVTNQGTHCQDLEFSSQEDPDWLREQRSKEVEIITKWVKQYQDNLLIREEN